jgi:hypothetical protein
VSTRVVAIGVNPENQHDVIVQERHGDRWVNRAFYNSLSDDHAYTNAGDCAKDLARKIGQLAAITAGERDA